MKQHLHQIMIDAIGKQLQSVSVENLWKEIGEKPEIEKDDEVLFYEFKSLGISCLFNEEKALEAIHLYGESREGFQVYLEELPHRLSFKNSRADALKLLGHPSLSGGGIPSLLGGKVPNWIKYIYPSYELHLEFKNEDREIAMVTLIASK